jgi:DnaJ-class molecular chaperone
MPRLDSPQTRGSMYVIAQISIPSNLSEREQELFQELRSLSDNKE